MSMQNRDSQNDVVISFHDGYLHITHPDNFVLLSKDLDALWQNLFEACRQYKSNRVLNEGNIDLSKLRAFDSYSAGTKAGEIEGLRMACLFPDFEPDERAEFFKTVASNRGAMVEFFTDRRVALKWLGVSGSA
jgi:hypothetical protein